MPIGAGLIFGNFSQSVFLSLNYEADHPENSGRLASIVSRVFPPRVAKTSSSRNPVIVRCHIPKQKMHGMLQIQFYESQAMAIAVYFATLAVVCLSTM